MNGSVMLVVGQLRLQSKLAMSRHSMEGGTLVGMVEKTMGDLLSMSLEVSDMTITG